jgi:hypothetical protein
MMENIQRGKRLMLVQLNPPPSKPNPRSHADRSGNFGKPTGELGRVEQANKDDLLVEWDGEGHIRLLKEL